MISVKNKEPQIYYGSKTIKEVYKGSTKIYPSINQQAIMDSLVCWYDPGKQQCTNESMVANPVLTDLSGNGHDITCYNFGWSGMSGIGGYMSDFTKGYFYPTTKNESFDYLTPIKFHFVKSFNTSGDIWKLKYIGGKIKLNVTGIPDDANFRIGTLKNTINLQNGINILDISSVVDADSTYGFSLSRTGECDITVEQLPLYPNALVSDGVDDYAMVEGLPILDDFTIVAKRNYISGDLYSSIASKFKNVSYAYDGAFVFESKIRGDINNISSAKSFGEITRVSNIPSEISYMTPTSYNGTSINRGSETDGDVLTLLRLRLENYYMAAALYSFLLFDRTLTTAEIEWVKKNMIESNDDAAEWYGVEFYTTSPNPDCIRIGNPNLHRTLPVHSLMRGCLLNDDGSVNKYLDASTWESETRDGSQGQVMVEVPDHYMRFETDGNIQRVKLSTVPIAGYRHIKKYYVSAYEATVQRSTTMLCSVVNMDADYRGGNNNAELDGTSATFLGKPATSISRTNFRNYARKRKEGSSEWNCMTYDIQKDLFWLFVIEYATLNTQKAFNEALTADGYHQGGLGPGVTEIDYTKWGDFNGRHPFIPCGHSDSLGNKTGVVDYTMPTEYDAASVKVCKVPRYRGIENPFGHIWQWTEGINVRISPNTEDGGDGLSKVFVCSDPSQFSDTGYEGYQYVGDEARTEAYVKEVIFGEGGEIMPLVVGGSSTTFFPDFHYTNIPKAETLRGVVFGGLAYNGAYAGFVYARSDYAPSASTAYFGSRLCFIPAQRSDTPRRLAPFGKVAGQTGRFLYII